MKKEVADRWVEALRSGRYKQCGRALHNDYGFCCLGVLCDISELDDWHELSCDSRYQYDESRDVLPTSVKEWAGMNTDSGILDNRKSLTSLAEENDNGKTFEEIANIIEEYWEEL